MHVREHDRVAGLAGEQLDWGGYSQGLRLRLKRGRLAARTLTAGLCQPQAANNRTMDHHTSVMRGPRERSAHRKAEAERKPLPP